MPIEFTFDPQAMVTGTVLRRALPYLLENRRLLFDPDREGALNDLVLGDIVEVPAHGTMGGNPVNWLERLHWTGDGRNFEIRREALQPGPFIGVLGNRYATPRMIGGLTHPLTGASNGIATGGSLMDSLFGVNCIGFLNQTCEPDSRVRVRLRGVLVRPDGQALNLRDFRVPVSNAPVPPEVPIIAVCGWATNAGKTTCVRSLVTGLAGKGFRVTAEKKSGTACCRDWLEYFSDCRDVPGRTKCGWPPTTLIDFDLFPARDFVDALGVASDVSLELSAFVEESIAFTDAFVTAGQPDFHVIELADGIAHRTNLALLSEPRFADRISALVYCPVPVPDAIAHFRAFVASSPALSGLPLILSGPVANEEQYEMVCLEVEERFGLNCVRSAVETADGWVAQGKELAEAILGPGFGGPATHGTIPGKVGGTGSTPGSPCAGP